MESRTPRQRHTRSCRNFCRIIYSLLWRRLDGCGNPERAEWSALIEKNSGRAVGRWAFRMPEALSRICRFPFCAVQKRRDSAMLISALHIAIWLLVSRESFIRFSQRWHNAAANSIIGAEEAEEAEAAARFLLFERSSIFPGGWFSPYLLVQRCSSSRWGMGYGVILLFVPSLQSARLQQFCGVAVSLGAGVSVSSSRLR